MIKSPIANPRLHAIAVGCILLAATRFLWVAEAFQSQPHRPQLQSHLHTAFTAKAVPQQNAINNARKNRSQLKAFPAATAATASSAVAALGRFFLPSSNLSKILRATALVVTVVLTASPRVRQRILWPGLSYPSADKELLPGSLGCPFIGMPFMLSNKPSYGAGSFYRTQATKLKATLGKVPGLWKYYFMGMNFAVLSGGKTFQKILSLEFTGSLSSSGVDLMEGGLLPTETILFEPDKKRHAYLRRLVGMALTPAAVDATAPTLQTAAEEQVSRMMAAKDNDEPVQFQKICTDYTLDVAWRQILGLELPEEEIPYFEQQVATWIEGIMTLRVLFRVGVKSTPGYKAREYIASKIGERIDELLEQGPDNKSTLSGMVFATDDEGGTGKKLTREEIIANALILIFAGSETSASTLTNAMLFLGLHPSVWDRLFKEQEDIRAKYGDTITPKSVDASNAPYLDAVLKESLRMRTIVGGIPRKALEDIDVDGDGKTIIPKGWLVDPSMLLTHEEDPATKLPDAMHMDAIQGFRPERWLKDDDTYETPNGEWYVPYGYGPRYCLGKNLAQLEMKIFLATMVRKIGFPKLSMLPENYDFSPDKKSEKDPNYFSVQWSTKGAVIPNAADGVVATITVPQKSVVNI